MSGLSRQREGGREGEREREKRERNTLSLMVVSFASILGLFNQGGPLRETLSGHPLPLPRHSVCTVAGACKRHVIGYPLRALLTR